MGAMQPTFRDLIATNKRNSALLVLIFILFNAAVVLVLALGIMAYIDPDSAAHLNWGRAFLIGAIAGGIAFVIALLSYYAGDQLVLATSGAQQIDHNDDPELFNVVEEMAIA